MMRMTQEQFVDECEERKIDIQDITLGDKYCYRCDIKDPFGEEPVTYFDMFVILVQDVGFQQARKVYT